VTKQYLEENPRWLTLNLTAIRKSIMSGTYADGTPFDYSVCTTPFLYSEVITDLNLITPYVNNTNHLFFGP